MNVCVLDGVSGGHHHPVAEVDSNVTFSGGIIRSFKENKVTGLCFGLADVLALIPQAVGGGAPYIVAVLVVDPADVAGTVKPGFRGTPTTVCWMLIFLFSKSMASHFKPTISLRRSP